MEFYSGSEAETLACAARFSASLKTGDTVALQGPMGAGKTLFCRGVAQALGFTGPVASPTYALVREYAARFPIYHMDLYRLVPGADWEEIGLGHYLNGEGVCLVEWPERLPEALRSRFTHEVEMEPMDENERRIRIRSVEPRPR